MQLLRNLEPVLRLSNGLECSPGLRLRFALALQVERHGSANEVFQCRLIDLLAFVNVHGAPDISLEAGVEQTRRVFQRSSLGKRQLDNVLVRLSRADKPRWEKTGTPGEVALAHFHSSTISGSAACIRSRTFASAFPRQSPSSLIFCSMNAEADSIGGLSVSTTTLAPNLAALSARCNCVESGSFRITSMMCWGHNPMGTSGRKPSASLRTHATKPTPAAGLYLAPGIPESAASRRSDLCGET